MNKLSVNDNHGPDYKRRTIYNASNSDLTIAFALDFNTAGEKLTKKSAGQKYIGTYLLDDFDNNLKKVIMHCENKNINTINIAGNGIYTCLKYNWNQDQINEYVYSFLKELKEVVNFNKIISGGQTGVDIAGLVAGYKLNIDVEGNFPKNYLQRNYLKIDHFNTEEDILETILLFGAAIS